MNNCPFCNAVRFDEPMVVCDECQVRLDSIDEVVKQWNDCLNFKKIAVEVKVYEG